MNDQHLERITLTGQHVSLEPLTTGHAGELLAAATADRATFGYTNVPSTIEDMIGYIGTFQAGQARGTDLPFVQRRISDGVVVGCTRFLGVTWWTGRPMPVEVEIGGTWLATAAQRSALNTEAKLLLLTHAFETWGVHRVAVCTDSRNDRSRRAIERLGARFEGVLRQHRPAMGDAVDHGVPRDTAVYSMLPGEWPGIRDGLRQRLALG